MTDLNCSICEKPITNDRYEFVLEGRRQDFPPDGKWQDVTEIPTDDICPECFDTLIKHFRYTIAAMRRTKGFLQ